MHNDNCFVSLGGQPLWLSCTLGMLFIFRSISSNTSIDKLGFLLVTLCMIKYFSFIFPHLNDLLLILYWQIA